MLVPRQSCLAIVPLALLASFFGSAQAVAQNNLAIVRREVTSHHHGNKIELSADVKDYASSAIPTKPLLSGAEVKIKNRRTNEYLASCAACSGVAQSSQGLSNSCSNLLGESKGCVFAANSCLGTTYQIIKVGFGSGNPIQNGDLVALRSVPSKDGPAKFWAYLGTCGKSASLKEKWKTCPGSSQDIRLFKADQRDHLSMKALQNEFMWTINKEEGEGGVLLGEYVTINKAESNSKAEAAGTYLSVCGNSTKKALAKCGARSNVYTSRVNRSTELEGRFSSQWVVEANFNDACTDAADIAATKPETAKTAAVKQDQNTSKQSSNTTAAQNATKQNVTQAANATEDEAKAALVNCSCVTPGSTAAGKNAIKCTDGTLRHCAADEVCFAEKQFPKGKWEEGCKKKTTAADADAKTDGSK